MTKLEIKAAKRRLELENELLLVTRKEKEILWKKKSLKNELDSLIADTERYFYFEAKINSLYKCTNHENK